MTVAVVLLFIFPAMTDYLQAVQNLFAENGIRAPIHYCEIPSTAQGLSDEPEVYVNEDEKGIPHIGAERTLCSMAIFCDKGNGVFRLRRMISHALRARC
ncbi:hypothetical protein BDW59DRAFT_138250 [Aspergillus cavernicola]|uniref:Uncharacterized protein n=1 Tax=Aspergillus cavernicola TaxID=176166 RepID=A0ABR4J1I0_9EURO